MVWWFIIFFCTASITLLDNVKNVYEIQSTQTIENKKIVLFDDIYTTGNTVNECSHILKENGAKEILVLTLAR